MLRNTRILISDDDETLCYLLKEELINEGFIVDVVYDGREAIASLQKNQYDLLLLDLEMKEVQGDEVLRFVRENIPDLTVIVLTANAELRTAVNCIKLGAYDFITKPYKFEQLLVLIERALQHRELLIENRILNEKVSKDKPSKIIAEHSSVMRILQLSEKAAQSDSNVLLEGETGTGKELFSEFIHNNSPRSSHPFVAINCASLPDQLIESELFGFEKGAFTDAKAAKQGLVEIANGGTLFLDEIGELSLMLQPKLLRFLENGEFRRIGGVNTLKSNVRIIGATNKNLFEESEKKLFRKDLLFRLNVITLEIPPLRERGSDILLLANYFLNKKSPFKSPKTLSQNAEIALLNYSFPGNVRELEHIIERAIIFSDGSLIKAEDLNLPEKYLSQPLINSTSSDNSTDNNIVSLEEAEKFLIRKTLVSNNWNREVSARVLGISQKTLYTKIKKYSIK